MKLIVLVFMFAVGLSFFLGVLYGSNEGFGPLKRWPMVLYVGKFGKPCAEYKIFWMAKDEFQDWNGYDPSAVDCVE